MKHCLFVFLPIFILFISCRQKVQSNFQPDISNQTETVYDFPEEYAEEIIITGKVLNREFYPQEKELTLIIPFFRDMENQYRTPIQEDGSFYFTFPVYAKIREVSIRNYAEHLYVHPGDSIHLEIDFKDMFHPKVTGDAEKLNQEILAFTESGYYYMRDYGIRHDLSVEDFEAELKKEYNTRLERRARIFAEIQAYARCRHVYAGITETGLLLYDPGLCEPMSISNKKRVRTISHAVARNQ